MRGKFPGALQEHSTQILQNPSRHGGRKIEGFAENLFPLTARGGSFIAPRLEIADVAPVILNALRPAPS